MADRNGYIGRAPGDSAVTVARQSYTSSGITTNFTFNSNSLAILTYNGKLITEKITSSFFLKNFFSDK